MNTRQAATDYRVARRAIGNGDLLLFEGRGLYSRAIRWRTRSRITHCGIAWRAFGRVLVVEALVAPGVDVNPLSRYLAAGRRVWWHSLDPTVDRGAVVAHALAQWGERYASPLQLLRSFVCPRLARRLRLPADLAADRWFCSELVLSALYAGGYVPPKRRPPAAVAPGGLALLDCLEPRGLLRHATETE